jgi:hypothetical protein
MTGRSPSTADAFHDDQLVHGFDLRFRAQAHLEAIGQERSQHEPKLSLRHRLPGPRDDVVEVRAREQQFSRLGIAARDSPVRDLIGLSDHPRKRHAAEVDACWEIAHGSGTTILAGLNRDYVECRRPARTLVLGVNAAHIETSTEQCKDRRRENECSHDPFDVLVGPAVSCRTTRTRIGRRDSDQGANLRSAFAWVAIDVL